MFGKQPDQQQQEQQPATAPAAQPAVAAQQPGTTDNPEFPPYQVLQKGTAYDLRFYEVFPVVECDYQRREEGYLALGSYQDGDNSSRSRFGHTQPVVMSYHPGVSRSSGPHTDRKRDAGMFGRPGPCAQLLTALACVWWLVVCARVHACRGAR